MKRREFITLFGSAAAWPLAARAQQSDRLKRIGVLLGLAESDPQYVSAFTLDGLTHIPQNGTGHHNTGEAGWYGPINRTSIALAMLALRGLDSGANRTSP